MTFQFVRAGERRMNPIHKLGLKPVAAAGEGDCRTDQPHTSATAIEPRGPLFLYTIIAGWLGHIYYNVYDGVYICLSFFFFYRRSGTGVSVYFRLWLGITRFTHSRNIYIYTQCRRVTCVCIYQYSKIYTGHSEDCTTPPPRLVRRPRYRHRSAVKSCYPKRLSIFTPEKASALLLGRMTITAA